MWRHKEKSIFDTAKAQEAERLRQEQEYAKYLAEEPMREAAEAARIQDVINVLGRACFLKLFNQEPAVVGSAGLTDAYGKFTTPVFAVEYAHLKFNPGEYGVHRIKSPLGLRYMGRSPFSGRAFHKRFSRDERKIIDKYAPEMMEAEFEAVGLCSGCQEWGALGALETYNHRMFLKQPRIERYEDIASSIELFNEVASGLALDCGTLSVFGLDTSKASAAIECQNLKRAIEEENARRGTKTGQTLEGESRRLGESAIANAVRAARRYRS